MLNIHRFEVAFVGDWFMLVAGVDEDENLT